MNYTVYRNATGEVLRNGICSIADMGLQAGVGETVVEGSYPGDQYYWNGVQMVAFPPRPAQYIWDWTQKAWVPDLAGAKSLKRAAIERERDRRITAPVILYDSCRLDAAADSIDRLSKKLAAIYCAEARGEELPADRLVWRDADNVTHTFATQAEYKLWLCGLALAIDARGTDAFAWSWSKKAEVDAAQTVADVEAITLA